MAEGVCPPHRWLIVSDKAVKLEKSKDSNLLGREATCKRCGEETVLKERVHVGN